MTKIELTEWERINLLQIASSNALAFMSHDARGGLFPHERETMAKWKELADKLKEPTK